MSNIFHYSSVSELCRELHISRQTYYRWRYLSTLSGHPIMSLFPIDFITRQHVFEWLMISLGENWQIEFYYRKSFRERAERFDREFNLGNPCI